MKNRDLLHMEEPLHNDLVPYVEVSSELGTMLRHPLVYSLFLHPEMYALVNAQYKAKKELRDKYRKAEQWSNFVFLHERPYRINAFMEYFRGSDTEYWSLLSSIWIDSENIWQMQGYWDQALNSIRPSRKSMMTVAEQEKLREIQLEESVTAYRGVGPKGRHEGLSWTLDIDVAKFFLKRFNLKGAGKLYECTIPSANILAYIEGRDEEELIVRPNSILELKEMLI